MAASSMLASGCSTFSTPAQTKSSRRRSGWATVSGRWRVQELFLANLAQI
jgi:hypothetical protein